MASSFFFREDAFLDEVVGDHGFSLGGTFTIADLEEVQRGNAIDLFDRELGILHVAAFVLELLASGFELFINGMESLVFVIAKGFERQGVAEYCGVIYVCRAISPAAQYARPSALCPAGIRAFAPGYRKRHAGRYINSYHDDQKNDSNNWNHSGANSDAFTK